MKDKTDISNRRSLFKPAMLITFFSIITTFLNFLLQLVLAAKFGAKTEMDSYLAASVIPQFITVVLFSALNVTFIPIFIEYEEKGNKNEAWKIASICINLTLIVLSIIAFVCIICAPQIISITVSGIKKEGFLLTVTILRILITSMIFGGLNSFISSVCYAHNKFLVPLLAGVISGIALLLFVIAFEPLWGIKSVAIGTLVSSIVTLCVLAPLLLKEQRYQFVLELSHNGVRKVLLATWPLIVSGIFYRANTVIERMIASHLPEGSISYLGYSNAILSTITGIATGGISTAIFPLMSQAWAKSDLVRLRECFATGVRTIMLITFPIAVLIVVLRVPIIQLGLERGAFNHRATQAVATILLIHLVYFICGAIGNVTSKGYYIAQKTKLRAVLGVSELIFYSSLACILSRYFSYMGLAIALSMSYIVFLPVDLFIMNGLYQGINGGKILDALIKISVASLSSGIFAYYMFNLQIIKNTLLIKTISTGIVSALLYLGFVLYIFKLEEAIRIREQIYSRVKNLWMS